MSEDRKTDSERIAEILRLIANYLALRISKDELLIGIRWQCDKLDELGR